MSAQEYTIHPLCAASPEMDEAAYARLRDDIAASRQLVPIWLDRHGRVVDGRYRLRACIELGLKPVTITMFDESETFVARVRSLNDCRRHLNESQRAMYAARLANRPVGRPSEQTGKFAGLTQTAAAAAYGVSERSVRDARAVQLHGNADLVRSVDAGQVSVSAAARSVHAPSDQRAIVRSGRAVVRQARRGAVIPISVGNSDPITIADHLEQANLGADFYEALGREMIARAKRIRAEARLRKGLHGRR